MKFGYVYAVLGLAALAGIGSAGAWVIDVAKLLSDFDKKKDALSNAGAMRSDDYNKLVDDTMAQIDLDKMSTEDAVAISRFGLLTNPNYRPKALDRLTALSASPSVSGVIALSMALELDAYGPSPSKEKRAEMVKQILGHAKLPEALGSDNGDKILSGLSTVRLTVENKDRVFGMIDHLKPSLYTGQAMSSYWSMVKFVEPDAAKCEPVRLKIVKLVRDSGGIAKASGAKENQIQYLQDLVARLDGAAARGMLIGNKAPSLDILWSSDPALRSLGVLKGKVVILDFWATWCGPCVASFPNVKTLQNHYKGFDVIIVGVTSVQGNIIGLSKENPIIDTKNDPKKEFSLMPDYMKAKDMSWPVVFTKQKVFNPDFGISGIPHVAIIDPAGVVRYGGLHPAEPLEKKTKLIDGLLKEFNLKVPSN